MKIFLIILCLIPLTAFANPLPHTKWVDESASQCPTAIFFGVKKYLFLNRCYARGSDGVVEKGIYAVSGKSLILANRRFSASGNFVFVPPQLKSLPIISLSQDRFVVNIDGKAWHFRRVRRGPGKQEMHTPKNKPIKYSPPGLDAPIVRAAYF